MISEAWVQTGPTVSLWAKGEVAHRAKGAQQRRTVPCTEAGRREWERSQRAEAPLQGMTIDPHSSASHTLPVLGHHRELALKRGGSSLGFSSQKPLTGPQNPPALTENLWEGYLLYKPCQPASPSTRDPEGEDHTLRPSLSTSVRPPLKKLAMYLRGRVLS